MNKYELLNEKLDNIYRYVCGIKCEDEYLNRFILKFEDYVKELIIATNNKNLAGSSGATLGLVKAISDFDVLCNDKSLWDMVVDADRFYSNECISFT